MTRPRQPGAHHGRLHLRTAQPMRWHAANESTLYSRHNLLLSLCFEGLFMSRDSLIDGWRGMGASFVLIGHLAHFRFAEYFEIQPFDKLLSSSPYFSGELAKNIAFRLIPSDVGSSLLLLIGGFLIARSAITEEKKGGINVLAFYARRSCRILPPLYLYISFLFLLSACEVIQVPTNNLLLSGTFLCIPGGVCTWFVGHTWTLSLQEPFYLFLVVLLVSSQKEKERFLITVSICLVILSFFFPIVLRFTYIAIGALVAVSPRVKQGVMRLADKRFITFAAIVLLLHPMLHSFPVIFHMVSLVRPLMFAIIVFGTNAGSGPFTALVSNVYLQRLGLASYSVYLWQQLSTASPELHGNNWILCMPILFVIPALLSYFLVEKPSIELGRRLSNAIKDKRVMQALNNRWSRLVEALRSRSAVASDGAQR
jgi:peptidoglycan/LPS O-acetylase OafA/YrhL